MKIYEVIGLLQNKLIYTVNVLNIINETEEFAYVSSNTDTHCAEKKIDKNELNVIRCFKKSIDSEIGYNMYILDEKKIDDSKAKIKSQIIRDIEYYEQKLYEKIKVLGSDYTIVEEADIDVKMTYYKYRLSSINDEICLLNHIKLVDVSVPLKELNDLRVKYLNEML